MGDVRKAVEAELTALTLPDSMLGKNSASATVNLYGPADLSRQRFQAKMNVVIEGTLTWVGLGGDYLVKLAGNDYERLTIVDVEVSFETARKQAGDRWWSGRTAAQNGTGHPYGGRFTPIEAIRASFPSGEVSVCNLNATRLFNDPRARNFEEMRLIVADRTTPEGEDYEFVSNYGTITGRWPMGLADLRRLKRMSKGAL